MISLQLTTSIIHNCSIVRQLFPRMRHVEPRIRIGGMSVPTSPWAEPHVAALDGAFVHLSQVYGTIVDF